jgi:hypothetical protein
MFFPFLDNLLFGLSSQHIYHIARSSFKSLYVVENYVGSGDVACITFEYNVKIIFVLLMNVLMC